MNRLCIFAHYDRDNLVDEYVLYFLQNLKTVSNQIIFVTTSNIAKDEMAKIKRYCDKIIIRENQGYDFVSWQEGLKAISGNSDFDELVFCNDSVYGPLYPLPDVFDTMSSKNCDFWGITDSYEINYHLQSYFLVFKKNVIRSEIFQRFWNDVKTESSKNEVIKKYEVGITRAFISAGFKPQAYLPTSLLTSIILRIKIISVLKHPFNAVKLVLYNFIQKNMDFRSINPTHFLWKDLIVKYKMPFLKIELLRDNPSKVDIRGYENIIKDHTSYDTSLIINHLSRTKRNKC
jgi:lipopolysaccharide biosynthesis protein